MEKIYKLNEHTGVLVYFHPDIVVVRRKPVVPVVVMHVLLLLLLRW